MMNDDLIHRSALMEKARNYYPSIDHYCLSEKAVPLKAVKAAAAVDAVEVVHGWWIEHEWAEECEGLLVSNFECSVCHNWERKDSDYCPNCGAKMDGERKDNE